MPLTRCIATAKQASRILSCLLTSPAVSQCESSASASREADGWSGGCRCHLWHPLFRCCFRFLLSFQIGLCQLFPAYHQHPCQCVTCSTRGASNGIRACFRPAVGSFVVKTAPLERDGRLICFVQLIHSLLQRLAHDDPTLLVLSLVVARNYHREAECPI